MSFANGVEAFLEELDEITISPSDVVPKLKIPNWPKEAEVVIELGRRTYRLPVRQSGSRLLGYSKQSGKLTFHIFRDGSVQVILEPNWLEEHVFIEGGDDYGSASSSPETRLVCLLLLQQFADVLFPKIIEKLREDSQEHGQVIEEAKAALEPFIPWLVADVLAD